MTPKPRILRYFRNHARCGTTYVVLALPMPPRGSLGDLLAASGASGEPPEVFRRPPESDSRAKMSPNHVKYVVSRLEASKTTVRHPRNPRQIRALAPSGPPKPRFGCVFEARNAAKPVFFVVPSNTIHVINLSVIICLSLFRCIIQRRFICA